MSYEFETVRRRRQAFPLYSDSQERQTASNCFPNLSQANFSSSVDQLQAEFVNFFCNNSQIITDYYSRSFVDCCLACLSSQSYGSCSFDDPNVLSQCGFDINCLTNNNSTILVTTSDECSSFASSTLVVIESLTTRYCNFTTTTAKPAATNRTILDMIVENAPAAIATIGGVGALTGLIQPPPSALVTPQGIPSGNPLPGTPGGGAPPVPSTPQATTAIGLAPPGTVPVAIFPPYDTPRTVSAISVIFAENPSIVVQTRRNSLTRKVSNFATRGKYFLLYFTTCF